MTQQRRKKEALTGKLKIGSDWNAITIIALSQHNPLKAVAEFVENSIDAQARNITITRGRERGEHFLSVTDDGNGVPRDDNGVPDFRYVATHVCDSIKRRMKLDGATGIQGEFGIGLLSFWTVGEELAMSSAGADGTAYEMRMKKGDPSYSVVRRRTLVPEQGTWLKIRPLLPGIRQLSGEKLQWYLASELRERIRQSGVNIKVIDRQTRKEFLVEPRAYVGQLLHQLPMPGTPHGDIYLELYLNASDSSNQVGLYRGGTRILASLTEIDAFQHAPWTELVLQGMVDVPFLQLTPATRTGVVHDAALESFIAAMAPVEEKLQAIIDEQKQAEEEQSNRTTLRTIQRAFREAFLALPAEEYDWFDINLRQRGSSDNSTVHNETDGAEAAAVDKPGGQRQKAFFEYAGPLHSVRVSPASSTLAVGKARSFRALARDRGRRVVTDDIAFAWKVLEGDARLENVNAEYVTFHAPDVPGLARIEVTACQNLINSSAEAIVTVTDTLIPEPKDRAVAKSGLPGYTFEHAPGQLWRSRHDGERNLIVINNGHRDFIYAARTKALKLRYLARLFAKEMVTKNFPGLPPDQLLERLIELLLYTEENLK